MSGNDAVSDMKTPPLVTLGVYGYNFFRIFNGVLCDTKKFEEYGVAIHPLEGTSLTLLASAGEPRAIYIGSETELINRDTCEGIIFYTEEDIIDLIGMVNLKLSRGAKSIQFEDGYHMYSNKKYHIEEVKLALFIASINFRLEEEKINFILLKSQAKEYAAA